MTWPRAGAVTTRLRAKAAMTGWTAGAETTSSTVASAPTRSYSRQSSTPTTNVDTIEDFDVLADVLELGAAVFSGLAAGALGAAAFVKGAGLATAQDASDRIIYNSTTGELYFDADGTGAGARP